MANEVALRWLKSSYMQQAPVEIKILLKKKKKKKKKKNILDLADFILEERPEDHNGWYAVDARPIKTLQLR